MKRNFNLLCSKINWEQVTRIWKGIIINKCFAIFTSESWLLVQSSTGAAFCLIVLFIMFFFVLQHLGFLQLLFVMICWIVSFRLEVVYTVDVVTLCCIIYVYSDVRVRLSVSLQTGLHHNSIVLYMLLFPSSSSDWGLYDVISLLQVHCFQPVIVSVAAFTPWP